MKIFNHPDDLALLAVLDKEQMLVINFRSDPTVQQHIESIKAAFMNHPEVVGASASMTTPDAPPLNWYAHR